MRKKCEFCGREVVKILGSNDSCVNDQCPHYVPKPLLDSNLITYFSYHGGDDGDDSNQTIENSYVEDYDSFLFYSHENDYISRFEYRELNDFLEDYLFENNKIANFKRFLDDDEILDHEIIREKYVLMREGRDLENSDPKKALEFYKTLLGHPLFKKDYYIYKKLVKLEKDHSNQLVLIRSFFNSGIYCNRYHYLWFLKKLKYVSAHIPVSDEIVRECLKSYRDSMVHIKDIKNPPIPIAERITCSHGTLKVRTDEQYCLRQLQFELQEEAAHLRHFGQYEHIALIYKKLILDYGFKSVKYFRNICHAYRKLGDHENELKWIYGYFNRISRYSSYENDAWFNRRLDEFNIPANEFYHEGLFFDKNEHYMRKGDFKENKAMANREMWDYLADVKTKYLLVENGLVLEQDNLDDAIDYYKSLLGHELFENDYYVHKTLVILYDQKDNLDNVIETVFSFFKSGIYCDRYNYLFFIYHLRKASQALIVHDHEIDEHLSYFKENGFENKHSESDPVALAERLVFRSNSINVIPEDEFATVQEIHALELEADLFQANSMFHSANDRYLTLISEFDAYDEELFNKMHSNYRALNDSESEKIMDQVLYRYLYKWDFFDRKWFKDILPELASKNNCFGYESDLEIFYEGNEYFLTADDYGRDESFTELTDRIRMKNSLRQRGRMLEKSDYQKAIEFYKKLLGHALFKNDYYCYRKLVILYVKINEYEMVFNTIKSFFKSGIYCDRYQYIWFLHKIFDVSKVRYISEEEIDDCLKSFKENGFKNKSLEDDPVFLAERLFKFRSSIKIFSSDAYYKTQKKYELKEEARQYELNGADEESIRIFRNLIDNQCISSPRDYMRLCHMYRRTGDYENELYVVNKYLSGYNQISRSWFEDRLEELKKLGVSD